MMPLAPSRAKSASDMWSGCRLSQALSRFPVNSWARITASGQSPGHQRKWPICSGLPGPDHKSPFN